MGHHGIESTVGDGPVAVPQLVLAVDLALGWGGGVVGGAKRVKTFFFGRRGIY